MKADIITANPLGTERIGRLMVRYAIPSIISIVVNSLYNMVDQIFIGQGVGYLGNAATNIILPVSSILLALGFMIGDGTASYMSLSLGKGDGKDAAYGVGNAITLTVGVSVALLILFEIFLEPLCHLFGATEGNLPYALEYGSIIILGFPFAMVDGAFGSIIRADGRPKVRSCTNSRRTHLDGKFSACLCQKILKYTQYSCAFLASAVKKFARQSAHFSYWYSF